MFSDEQPTHGIGRDVRLQGFSDRISVAAAASWIEDKLVIPGSEEVAVGEAAGRVLAAPVTAAGDIPPADCAASDGYAVRAGETTGASNYNPLSLAVEAEKDPLTARPAAVLIAAGLPLPGGADAVLPFTSVQPNSNDTGIEIFGPVAPGTGMEQKGQQISAGTTLIERRRPLRPQDLGVMAALGVERVRVLRRPRVCLIVPGPKSCPGPAAGDANGPMLRALVQRDGGIAEDGPLAGDGRSALARAMASASADLILVAGRTATGPDDEAPLALAAVGKLAIHGVALRPGGSTGIGLVGRTPVFLLPGDPIACLCAYDLLAAPCLRRLSGRDRRLPYFLREAEVGRKIVSAVGFVDVCRVRFAAGKVEPVGTGKSGGLVSAVRADGFVLVPAPLEGYPPGARVSVHCYEEEAGES